MSGRPIDALLPRLKNVKQIHDHEWKASSPTRPDRKPSLSIKEKADGTLLLKDFGGDTNEEIVAALGMEMKDLFPAKQGGGGYSSPPASIEHSNASGDANNLGCTLVDLATLKHLPMDFLREQGLAQLIYQGVPAVRLPYPGVDGAGGPTRFRTALVKGERGDDRFKWKRGDKPTLYGLSRIEEARKAGYVVLCEGESDCWTLWYHGFPALGIPGASNWKEERDAPHLDGIETIFVIIEPDTGGEAVKKWLAKSAIRERVRLVSLGEHKDPSSLHIADPEAFESVFESVFEAAVAWTARAEAERKEEAEAAYSLARGLLYDPALLAKVGEKMRERGYAGDVRPSLLRLHRCNLTPAGTPAECRGDRAKCQRQESLGGRGTRLHPRPGCLYREGGVGAGPHLH